MTNQTKVVEVESEAEGIDIMAQYFRSYDLLALQALERGDGVCTDEMCSKRDAAHREYCGLTKLHPTTAFMQIMQPSGLI